MSAPADELIDVSPGSSGDSEEPVNHPVGSIASNLELLRLSFINSNLFNFNNLFSSSNSVTRDTGVTSASSTNHDNLVDATSTVSSLSGLNVPSLTRPIAYPSGLPKDGIEASSTGQVKSGRSRPLANKTVVSQIDSHNNIDDLNRGYGQDESLEDGEHNDESTEANTLDLKRRQRAMFSSWIAETSASATYEEIQNSLETRPDELLPKSALMTSQVSQLIVNTPREYQLELFERAKERNTIAVLDTGSGKTLIAVLLLKHSIEQELERRHSGLAPKLSFFLVNSVALVLQQFAVLERNLDHKVMHLYGDMGVGTWNSNSWQDARAKNMVIVCTAEILLQCLVHSFVGMEQINLLIFDEAHHTKKGHPYARIIKDFYRAQREPTIRPRIFAMTASPIDAKGDISQVARDLEHLLDSQIATVSDLSLVHKCISHPSEEVATYNRLEPPFETLLHQKLQIEFSGLPVFDKLFHLSKIIASELGRWCCHAWWSFALEEKRLNRLDKRAEQEGRRHNVYTYRSPCSSKPDNQLDQQIDRLQAASRVAQAHHLGEPRLDDSDDLSPKVKLLVMSLRAHFTYSAAGRCIVFVERRDTAQLLERIFKYSHISGPHIRVASFFGSGSRGFDDVTSSARKQILTMCKFRKGEVNLLFATSVAEEGIDVPDCNLVVRFDLYKTMIAYIQSRGRARHTNSKYIHMVEEHNDEHAQMIWYARRAEDMMNKFCHALPADRIMDESEEARRRCLEDVTDERAYIHPETKAKLTYMSSLVILDRYVSLLPGTAETMSKPMYTTYACTSGFISEVCLPENAPIASVQGNSEKRKILARASAAFNACLKLLEHGHLDSNFVSTQRKRLPAMRNALLALNLKKSNMYDMMIKPKIWEVDQGTVPLELHLMILDLPTGCERPHTPIGLLTRVALPELPTFPLFLLNGRESLVRAKNVKVPLNVNTGLLEKLDKFTRTVYLEVFAKNFEADLEKMSYWIAPLAVEPGAHISLLDPSQIIDWNALENVWHAKQFDWNENWTDESMMDRFFWDPYDGGKRYFTHGVESTLNMNSLVPGAVENPDKKKKTIKEFTVSLWTSSSRKRDEVSPYNVRQPVLRAEKMMQRRNLLDVPTSTEKESRSEAYIIPEPLKMSPLSTRIVTMVLTLPCIIHRLESYLIAMEACQLLGLNIPLDLALEAVTKDSDNTDEHRATQTHVQRGMGKNYERLEFLGDAFLKMATSIAVYTQNPDSDEFEFHVKRMLLICNQTLFDSAKDLHLTRYIRSQSFSRRLWYQPGLKLLKGKKLGREGEKYKHSLGDKTIADICEALIGAAFLAHNEPDSWTPRSWNDAIHAVTTFVSSEDHTQQKWDDYISGYKRPSWEGKNASAAQVDLANKVELEHPYHFQSPKMLQVSFKHPSYPRGWLDLPSYQRLEFLGDALLEVACVTHLFYRYPNKDPQWLTEHKMAMVSNRFLGAICVRLRFYKHLLTLSDIIPSQVSAYVSDIQEAEAVANGAKDYWTNVRPPPKCLPDVVEAYIGAIFIDSGFDYNEVQRFFNMHIKPFFEDMEIYDSFAKSHPTTRLYHLLDNLGCSGYRIMAQQLPSLDQTTAPTIRAAVIVHDEIIGKGEAASGKSAKVKASKDAWDNAGLQGLSRFDFQAKFSCNCGATDDGKKAMDGESTAI